MAANTQEPDVELGVQQSDLDSLPCVVESVSHAQRQQSDKLTQHQSISHGLKIHLQEELEKVSSVQKELKDCQKKHFYQQEGITEYSAKCELLKKEIVQLLEEDFQLSTDITDLEKKLQRDQRIHDEYSNKVIHHKTQVLELEKTNPIQLALAKQEILLDQLQTEKAELLSQLSYKQSIDESRNDQVMRLKEEVESLRGNKRQLEKQIEEKESLIQDENKHQGSLLQDISVLKKRNHAQLLRLRNQVKEAQIRNHQWHEEANQMEQQIAHLQQLIADHEA
ncbi:uncharacterized protein [Apostichopus japonicus]|uniref:uncharacterized protein n=1 Tax=Stichopus japonicus TaxID=307972 RepID=UPI003AB17E69